jgi:hypothetical protein
MHRTTMLVLCAFVLLLCAGSAFAQLTYPDTLKIDYFINANSGQPFANVQVTNTDLSGGNLCAAFYVFDPQQEMSECCSCNVTPNGLLTLSVDNNLVNNPVSVGPPLTTGTIWLVSASGNAKGACLTYPDKVTPTAGLRAWVTHVESTGAGPLGLYPFAIWGDAMQDESLSVTELAALETQCKAISLLGSGAGVCTCGSANGT